MGFIERDRMMGGKRKRYREKEKREGERERKENQGERPRTSIQHMWKQTC